MGYCIDQATAASLQMLYNSLITLTLRTSYNKAHQKTQNVSYADLFVVRVVILRSDFIGILLR